MCLSESPTSDRKNQAVRRKRSARRPRTRCCLLKGCEKRFRPRQASQRYCSAECRRAARKWSGWKAQQKAVSEAQPPRFDLYRVRPIAPSRTERAYVTPEADVAEIKQVAAKGPDFAGRYAVTISSCRSWCENAVITDIKTGATYAPPFFGAAGCFGITRDASPIQRQADSWLMVIRGLLEMTYAPGLGGEGPFGVFSFLWEGNRLRLLSCRIAARQP